MIAYFDSSSWAKRYVEENGSDQVEEICARIDVVCLSILCLPEIISALSRLFREGLLTRRMFNRTKKVLPNEIKDVKIINITPLVVIMAIDLLEHFPLRTLDALHIASALEAHIELFVTSDRRQAYAAEKSGLRVEVIG